MRTWLGWFYLALAIGTLVIGPLFGVEHSGHFNDPITSTDLFIYGAFLAGLIVLEVRDAARYVVKQIKEGDDE